jgi:hypothetical protein
MNYNWTIRLLLLSVVIDHLHEIEKRVRLLWNTCTDQMMVKSGRVMGGKGEGRGREERKKGEKRG